jgi:tRNA-modifying protein YgfZ
MWVGGGHQAGAASLPFASLDIWRWLDVQSGIPMIEAATADQFVPQMINFELLDGVNFQKGCYPGQEVVARSQYRGVIKRRLFLFHGDQAMQAGQEVFHSADSVQPAGMVVNAAPCPAQVTAPGISHSALLEIKLSALETGSAHLESDLGAVLHRGTLPYEVSVTKDAESASKSGAKE